MRRRQPRLLAFSGPSGVGKTTLLEALIPALVRRGLAVAALKHSGHPHSLDRPGKDSARLRRAGAVAVAVQGPAELAWFGPPRAGGARALAQLLPEVDLVVAEGFKEEDVPRVEVHRTAVSRRFLARRDRRVVAVVSDVAPPRGLPWFTPAEVEPLADFVARFTLRGSRAPGRALAASAPRAHRVPEEALQPREKAMARTTSRSSTARRSTTGRGRARGTGTGRGRRGGGATVREAGRKGGRRTLERRGPEFYSRIGRKGGKASGARRGAAARARRAGSRTGRGRRTGRRGTSR